MATIGLISRGVQGLVAIAHSPVVDQLPVLDDTPKPRGGLHRSPSPTVDPVEGGCANDYAYSFGDPANHPDLNGEGGCPPKKHHSWLGKARRVAGYVGVAAAVVDITIATAGANVPFVVGICWYQCGRDFKGAHLR